MYKLLIADGSEELRQALAQALDGEFILQICADGAQASSALRQFQPDILVLDLMVSKVDGMTLLREASLLGLHPLTLVSLPFVSDFILGALHKYEVAYLMTRPCTASALAGQIRELAATLEGAVCTEPEPAIPLSTVLLELGLSPRLDGYKYLLQAIPMYMGDTAQALTKELYAAVGHAYNKSINQVERSMRNAIHSAWARGDIGIWRRYFPAAPDGTVPRPCIGEFVARIAAHIGQQEMARRA